MNSELRTGWYDGDRAALRALFEEAEDSAAQLDAYVDDGRVLVAWRGDAPVGHLQLVDAGAPGELELKNMAVVDRLRGRGVGHDLVEAAIRASHADGHRRMVVATAAADTGNLRFYQRCGFRFTRIERDFFGPETGYPDEVVIDGIPLRDRVWFDREL
jgi:GNAT superfamily N-acetyltransferase